MQVHKQVPSMNQVSSKKVPEIPFQKIPEEDRKEDRKEESIHSSKKVVGLSEKLVGLSEKLVGPSEKLETVFILDWDDTLCASAVWSEQQQHQPIGSWRERSEMSKAEQEEWLELGSVILHLLETMIQVNPVGVFIVTNGQQGWVEWCIAHLLPELALVEPKLTIISARSEFSREGSQCTHEEMTRWKYRAMTNLLIHHKVLLGLSKMPQVIACGDSNVERCALNDASVFLQLPWVKFIKFIPDPTVSDLVHQLHQVSSLLTRIINKRKHLYLVLNVAEKQKEQDHK